MGTLSMPKRLSSALLQSLSAGVVPRIGLEYLTVGRKEEVEALLEDLRNIADGAAAFRIVVGRFGSGKSHLLQVMRNQAMERGFVVADADLSPERKLASGSGQALATYRELMRHLATKLRPEGGALGALLERWISDVQLAVTQETGLTHADPRFTANVELRIMETVRKMEGMVHGYDFATVLAAYWRGYRTGETDLKDSALRWLRGEFSTKAEAHKALGVRVIIDDATWYDYVKLLANFVTSVGYKGLIVVIDEAINLYNLSRYAARQANYETLLAMFNDTMQGKAQHLGILVGGTPPFVDDPRRGLFSYEALRSRLEESRFMREGTRHFSGPLVRLSVLTAEELFVLLERVADIHACHYEYERKLTADQLSLFLQTVYARVGAKEMLTPREMERDLITVLSVLMKHPERTFEQVVVGDPTVLSPLQKSADEDEEFAEFQL